MVVKHGQPKDGVDWCRKLAYTINEMGEDHPSNHALSIAEEWEKHNPEAATT
jgi:hypothetical protein